MSLKDRINAIGRDFRDARVAYIWLFFGTLVLMFGFWTAYFGPKSSWTNILFMYFLIMGSAMSLTGLGSVIAARWSGRKPY